MTKFKEKQEFLKKLSEVISYVVSLGLSVEGSRNINDDTAFEISVAKDEDSLSEIQKIEDVSDLIFDGYSEKEKTYDLIFCQKTPERKLRDSLKNHLISLGLFIEDISETSPNKGFLFTVKADNTDIFKNLDNFESLIFDGYTSRGEFFDLVYIIP